MSLILYIYSLIVAAIFRLLKILSLFSSSLRDQISDRSLNKKLLDEIIHKAEKAEKKCIFFVSSAGEYEQAKPLIEKLKVRGGIYVLIIFFSNSGYEYARALNEESDYIKAPIDTIWNWCFLFRLMRPDLTVIVRHELWPAFCFSARAHSKKFILIDGQKSSRADNHMLRLAIDRFLFSHFDLLYVLRLSDKNYFQEILQIPEHKVVVAGDTKYDRVFQRIDERRNLASSVIDILGCYDSSQRRLVIGSAWLPDVDFILEAFQQFSKRSQWQIIIAPHDISPEMLGAIDQRCKQRGLSVQSFSSLSLDKRWPGFSTDVLILDCMGILAEVYASVDGAFVGGALHARVHNVLEPACRGIPLTFGPNYHTSIEAIHLVENRLVVPVKEVVELLQWWLRIDADESRKEGLKIMKSIKSLCGATDLIGREIHQDWERRIVNG